jgi:hypothetical protein
MREDDFPSVAELHHRIFSLPGPLTQSLRAAYRRYFREVYFENPWRDPRVGPLVCEEQGRIAGFLGVIPRPMTLDGKPVVAAVTSQFIADPASRNLAGVRLMKACLEGPQDLTFADESRETARRMWEKLGGKSVLCHSVHWLAALRPAQLTVSTAPRLGPLAAGAAPFAWLVDRVAPHLPRSPYARPKTSGLRGRNLDAAALAALLPANRSALMPTYTAQSLDWVLRRIESLRSLHGPLRAVGLETPEGKPAGCYLYHRKPQGVSRVVFVWAEPDHQDAVLAHLFADAWESGCLALGGPVPPRMLHAVSRLRCMFDDRPKWFLAHSRNPRILEAICGGDDSLSNMEGEWIAHFDYKAPQEE